jgi:hypothetical protein
MLRLLVCSHSAHVQVRVDTLKGQFLTTVDVSTAARLEIRGPFARDLVLEADFPCLAPGERPCGEPYASEGRINGHYCTWLVRPVAP